MEKTNYVLKGLGYSYIITLAILLIYNLLITFTDLGGNTIAMASSFITTLSSAFGGFYASKNIKEKGLIYGVLVGFLYIICLILIVFLAQDNFTYEIDTLYKIGFSVISGGIGGVLGVNFK
ncbi:TIGR04086 family membrane protein [Asaccharospora irregularis]|uniref:Putative membrane protein, TIGR04086 family n=1 Tax=Asaccharospora irregularis DSM 2635 TaxID=1121321 RepID=A0A1M5J855_9FIRM|nr:TIGR04086 family membrane protein [Asaccharospora irregularis]SHG36732.1 putative membrane protein, TIGR04086 family [Asaccharospora irregularis DSM 2635]